MSASKNLEYALDQIAKEAQFVQSLAVLMPGLRKIVEEIKDMEAEVADLRDGNEYILVRELREVIEGLEVKNLGLEDAVRDCDCNYEWAISQGYIKEKQK